jgi:hypothetical protein
MAGQWKEVVKLAFKGQRFRDHALDLSAVTELSQFQKLVAETAKTLWRAANPNRERIPGNFEDRTRLCLRRIDDGSAVAPLEVYLEDPIEPALFEVQPAEPTEVKQAVELAAHVFRSVGNDESLPESFPRHLIPEYEKFGQSLTDDDAVEVVLPSSGNGAQSVSVTTSTRARLAALAERSYEDGVDVTGEVLEADVRQRRFQLWVDDKAGITVSFSPEQEGEITGALRDHQSVRLQVIGRGDFSPQGKPIRITRVDELRLRAIGVEQRAAISQPIETVLGALGREVPKNEWANLPSDLTDNLDHYLYGIPKQ